MIAMGTAIAVRTDFSSQKLRRLATRVKDAAQARRLLAIAAVLDSAAREEAAKIGGMDRQTLRDWVIRFNDQGPGGLINKSSSMRQPARNPTSKRRELFNRPRSTGSNGCRGDSSSISDKTVLVRLPVITAVETAFGKARRKRAY